MSLVPLYSKRKSDHIVRRIGKFSVQILHRDNELAKSMRNAYGASSQYGAYREWACVVYVVVDHSYARGALVRLTRLHYAATKRDAVRAAINKARRQLINNAQMVGAWDKSIELTNKWYDRRACHYRRCNPMGLEKLEQRRKDDIEFLTTKLENSQ